MVSFFLVTERFTALFIGQAVVNIYSAGSKVKSKMAGRYKHDVCG